MQAIRRGERHGFQNVSHRSNDCSCQLCAQFRCLGGDLFKRLSERYLRVSARRHREQRHPCPAAVTQVTCDSTTAMFTEQTTASHDGVIATEPLTGTYAVGSNCTGTGNPTGGNPFSLCGYVNRVSGRSPFFGGF